MSIAFKFTRGALVRFAAELEEQIADIQPDGFNNNIRWHLGHVLTTAEQLLFGYPSRSNHLPPSYLELFRMGSTPASWTQDIPTIQELASLLENQTTRIHGLSEDFFKEALPYEFPIGSVKTFGDVFEFATYHEAEHLGQMKAMKRIVQTK